MNASPYLTASEAAAYLRFVYADGSPNMNAFYQFRHRTKLRALRRGGKLLFLRTALDAVLEDEAAALRIVPKARRA